MGLLDDIRRSLANPTPRKTMLYRDARAKGLSAKQARKVARSPERPRPSREQRTAWNRWGIL